MVVFDFDKTITRKHTGGAVMLPAYANDDFIKANFADLEFFKFVVPFIRAQNCLVGIASFGQEEPEAVLSGIPLIRKYLKFALGDKSEELIPDELIALWHPDSKGKEEKKVGKQDHLEYLLNAKSAAGVKMNQIALFDDDENNCKIASQKKARVWFCPAVKSSDTTSPSGFHREIWAKFISDKGKAGGGCVLM